MRAIRNWIIFLVGLFFRMDTMAQPVHLPVENSYITAGAYSSHFLDVFSFQSNPACLAGFSGFRTGILTERKWMLKELGLFALAANCSLAGGGLGIAIQQSGDPDFHEQALLLAYGKKLGRVDLGIRFEYLRDQALGYAASGFGSSGLGIRIHLTEKLIAGWDLGLPVFGMAGLRNTEKGPFYFRMGFGDELSSDLLLSCQIVKSAGSPLNIIFSTDYHYNRQFFFSFGLNSSVNSFFFKSGWKKNRVCIQIYTAWATPLGFSPGIQLLFDPKRAGG